MSVATEPISLLPSHSRGRTLPRAKNRRRVRSQQIEIACGKLLEQHWHFGKRIRSVQFRCVDNCLTLVGCLPSYYLKQLAQEAIRPINNSFEFIRIDNQIVVIDQVVEAMPSRPSVGFDDGTITKQQTR